MLRLFGSETDGDAAVFGPAEEGFDGDASTAGLDAGGVLLVGLLLVVAGIEAADAVEVVAAAFSEGVGQSKADGEPVVIPGGDVNAGLLDAAGDLGWP